LISSINLKKIVTTWIQTRHVIDQIWKEKTIILLTYGLKDYNAWSRECQNCKSNLQSFNPLFTCQI